MVRGCSKARKTALERAIRHRKYDLIKELHQERGWSIGWMCRVLEISRAAYYKWLNRGTTVQDEENALLLEEIRRISDETNNLFGYRKMTMVLNRLRKENGKTPINRKRISRLMSVHQIYSSFRPTSRKRYPEVTPEEKMENVLGRKFMAKKPNQKWCTDVTEMKLENGTKIYISTILDLYDRYPVGWHISTRNDTELVNRTLEKALENNDPDGVLFHSDRGFQYTRKAFQTYLKNNGLIPSMSRVSHCIDNGPMEGFQGIIKDLCRILYPKARTKEEVVEALNKTYRFYIEEYPQQRFRGLTSGEVRSQALEADNPECYPIPINSAITKYWENIAKKGERKTL